jgi:DNA-binding FrmR family transcriptional regulator
MATRAIRPKDVRKSRVRPVPSPRVRKRPRVSPSPKTRPGPPVQLKAARLTLPPATRRYLRVRLARLAGHLQTVIRMIEAGADFKDVMTQLAAVRSGLTGVTAKMAEMYVTAWFDAGAPRSGDRRSLDALLNVLKFLARAY